MATKKSSKRPFRNGYVSSGGHDAYDVHDDAQAMPGYMPSNPKSFHVRVHANREKFGPGKTINVATNVIKTFDNFLTMCTESLKPSFGCARRLYTARGRHRIQGLDELHAGSIYVITGTERFRDEHYKEIPERLRPPHKKGFKKIDGDRIVPPVEHNATLRNKSGRCFRLGGEQNSLRLHVSLNGYNEEAWHTVNIVPKKRTDIEEIKKAIEEQLVLQKMKGLYKVENCGGHISNFKLVDQANLLGTGDHVLVVWRKVDSLLYPPNGMRNFHIPTSPRHMRPNNYDPFALQPSPYKYRKLPSIRSGQQSDTSTMSPFSNPPGSQGGRKAKRSKNTREVDYDKDVGGVYRSKNNANSRGAHQEEIHTKEKTTPIPPGTELNKQPSKETKQNTDNASQTKNKNEVKKGGKSGKEMNKVSVLPPIVDDEAKKGDTDKDKKAKSDKARKDDLKGIKDGHVIEIVDKYEGKVKEGEEGPFVDEKELTPKDLKTDDAIEISEREVSPVDLQSNELEVNKPPISTTPPQGNLSPDKGLAQERVDEDASPDEQKVHSPHSQEDGEHDDTFQQVDGMHRIDEYEDDSFNRFDQNTSGAVSKDPRSSTPASRGEARRKREQKEHEAAAKIQAGVRGYKARKDYQRKKEAKRIEDYDRRQQAEETRRQEEEDRDREMKAQKKQMDEDEAATRIQASFKGHKARKEYKAKQDQVRVSSDIGREKQNEAKAATKIQSSFKGYKVRKEYNKRKKHLNETDINDNEKKDIPNEDIGVKVSDKESVKATKMSEDNAAVAIQAGFKGYKTRKEYAQRKAQKKQDNIVNKTDNDKKEHTAASQIQANFRGYKVRKEYAEKKNKKKLETEEHDAAVRIQASFKGYKARKQLSKPKEPQLPDQAPAPKQNDDDELNKAATKIQSGFRGYKTRKEYKSKVIEEHIVETDVAQLPDSAVSRSSLKKGQFIQGSRNKVVSKIQSAFRVYHAKKILEQGGDINFYDFRKSRVADETIIAAYRGFRTRQIEKEHLDKKNLAAVKIQAIYKGYNVRKRNIYSIRAVNFLQAAIRGYITRKLNNVLVTRPTFTSVRNGDFYASKIQALCKGFLTRHTVRKKKESLDCQSNSASPLQGPTVSNLTEETEGEISYWKDTNIRMYSDKTLRRAAARIQSAVYAYKTRNMFENLGSKHFESNIPNDTRLSRESEYAFLKIQSCFKGHVEREREKDGSLKKKRERNLSKENKAIDLQDERERSVDLGRSDGETVVRSEKDEYGSGYQSFNVEEQHASKSLAIQTVKDSDQNSTGNIKDLQPHPPSTPRPVSARPVSSKLTKPEGDVNEIPISKKRGRPTSGKSVSQKLQPQHKGDSEIQDISEEEVNRSSTRLSGTAETMASESIVTISDFDKEHGRGSAKSYSTWKSSEKVKSSGGEIEREGESLREIEDDAGELSSIERNVNAVCQLQATFRAYKLRREISELMSGGGELMDIKKIDRAISALRKDFRLRSAKVRRLGSCQFEKDKPTKPSGNWWENDEDTDNEIVLQDRDDFEKEKICEKDESLNESMDTVRMYERSESVSKIRAAIKGYEVRRSVKRIKQHESRKQIEAAYRGYKTRIIESNIGCSKSQKNANKAERVTSAGSRTSAHSERTVFHVQMHSDVINQRCTRLQAAFAGCLTRRVFISLTKLVEQNEQSDHDTSGYQLERMGSLSETDDFKLRHKTIAKIQATYESYKVANESRKGSSKGSPQTNALSKFTVLPPIQQKVQLIHDQSNRPKSGIPGTNAKMAETDGNKSKTQPDLYRRCGETSENKNLNNIEIYVKKKVAATVVQAHAKAYITRREKRLHSERIKSNRNQHTESGKKGPYVGRKSPGSLSGRPKSGKVCFKTDSNKESKEAVDPNKKREDKTMTEMVRVRTASIKLEAERRKVIAEKMRLKQQSEFENRSPEQDRTSSLSPQRMTPIPSSRLVTERLHQANDLILREEKAVVQIQKVYRGYRTRKEFHQKIETRKQIDKEYSEWKEKRNDAATAIQSTWIGHSVRKQSSDEETSNEDRNESKGDDFSHLDKGLIVINIGRSKSEIERANRKFNGASIIQMTFRACIIRRKLAIKGAKRRHERNKAACTIQALYQGHWTRHRLKESVCATRIQSVFKAYLTRDNMQERLRVKEEECQRAASVLQAAYMSFRKRRENDALKKERRLNQAADNIQSAGKGFIKRMENKMKREHSQMRAASQIQSSLKGRMERKKMKVRKQAVSVIVAGFKSHKTRQDVQEMKDKLKRERIAATRVQSAYKAYLVRHSNKQYKEKMARQNKAATRVQCSFKGRNTRKQYGIQKEMMKMKRQAAALKIQSVYRGHQGRKIARKEKHIIEIHNVAEDMMNLILNRTFDYVRRRTDSSERIQATVKAYNTRKQMTCKHTDEAKQKVLNASIVQASYRAKTDRERTNRESQINTSATIIQYVFRARATRKWTNRKSQRNASATVIQSVFRAKVIRKKQENATLLELMNESATKIQSLYRGFRTRSEIQKEREMISNIEPPPTALISARTRSGKLLSISVDEVLMKNSRAIILFHRKATEIQEVFRAYITRREMKSRLIRKTEVSKRTPRRILSVSKRLTNEDRAAILIQKTFRCFWHRKVYRNAMARRKKLRNSASTNLQAAIKGYRVRLDERGREIRFKKEGMSEVWRKKQEAANIIAFAYRSYQHRIVKMSLRVEM